MLDTCKQRLAPAFAIVRGANALHMVVMLAVHGLHKLGQVASEGVHPQAELNHCSDQGCGCTALAGSTACVCCSSLGSSLLALPLCCLLPLAGGAS